MTEIREATGTCIVGASSEEPCPYPATEPMRGWRDGAPMLCVFHAATEPLYAESDGLALGLELFEGWEAEARQHHSQQLLELLERARAEFTARLERARAEFTARLERLNKVLEDLEAAESELMRS
jgi:hypothetical protein